MPSISKEEIIKTNLNTIETYAFWETETPSIIKAINKSMDEWAKHEGIAFHKWYRPFVEEKLKQCAGDKSEWLMWVNKSYEEYWELYLQSKQ